MCRDEIWLVLAEGVVAAGDDHELRAADRPFEMLADGRLLNRPFCVLGAKVVLLN